MEEEKHFEQIGAFLVFQEIAKDWYNRRANFILEKDDMFLDLQLMPGRLNTPFTQIPQSLRLTAEFISVNNLNPKYISAIAYEALAIVAEKRYGFHSFEEKNLPADYVEGFRGYYENFSSRAKKGKDMGKIMIFFMTKIEFLKLFLS